MASKSKECSIENYVKKTNRDLFVVFVVRAYHTVTKSLDFLNYIMPCRRQFD